ncbi:hypothetical protein QR680_006071 [Steinernema hermaphroditum]|uniref:Vacuolar protein sorting-associated protein 33A n=1 Tax=Steinernema hermaphroditum TaxID=289476 RepID=A0AA39LVX5_9BILA|nr:hypothetical protein QR680_006071 [Steinernema hermaphroditum]
MGERRAFSEQIREHGQALLLEALDSIPGAKAIVWDPQLMRRINLLTSVAVLNQRNVIFNLSINKPGDKRNDEVDTLVYLVGESNKSMNLLKECLNRSRTSQTHHIFFIPEMNFKRRAEIEQLRAAPKFATSIQTFASLPIRWFPSPTQSPDVANMLVDDIIPRLVLDNDWTQLHKCADALLKAESMMERRPTISYFGEWATKMSGIVEQLRTAREDVSTEKSPSAEVLDIDEVLVIDRWTDPVTPLLLQRTFGGLLDEFFGIDEDEAIRVNDAEFSETEAAGSAEKRVSLRDDIFVDIRDKAVPADVGREIRKITKELNEIEEECKSAQTVAEVKMSVKKIKELMKTKALVSQHTRLCEMLKARQFDDFFHECNECAEEILHGVPDKVVPFIEMSIIEGLDITEIIKLVCLHSLVCDGLRKETLDAYRKLIVDTYGSKCIPWLMCLQQAGLIREKGGETHLNSKNPIITGFAKTVKQMRLLIEETNALKPTDASYFYGGYASLLVRHLEGHGTQWKTIQGERLTLRNPKRMLFVVGGLTMAEIASIRFSLPDIKAICVTSTVTGTHFVRSFDQHGYAFKNAFASRTAWQQNLVEVRW